MIDQKKLIDHLKAEVLLACDVQHAYSMQPTEDLSEDTPMLYVYPAGEQSEDSDYDGVVIQQSEGSIAVLVVARMSALDAVRDQLLKALIGYQDTAAFSGMVHREGKPLDVRSGYIWWRDVFATSFQRRQS